MNSSSNTAHLPSNSKNARMSLQAAKAQRAAQIVDATNVGNICGSISDSLLLATILETLQKLGTNGSLGKIREL